jgi:hypothetical protein
LPHATLKSTIVALLAGSVYGAAPAAAQSGAECLFQCDAQCYGRAQPYCGSDCLARCNSHGTPSPREFYGSAYVSFDGSGVYGFSCGKNNQYDAMAEAAAQCKARGGPCRRLLIFANKCASFVYAKRSGRITGISGAAEPSRGAAARNALQDCQTVNPGGTCEIAAEFCSKEGDDPNCGVR